MRRKTVFVILSWLSVSAFFLGHALAQAPSAGQTQGAAQAPPVHPVAPRLVGCARERAGGQDQQGRIQARRNPRAT